MIKKFKDAFGIYNVEHQRQGDALTLKVGGRNLEVNFDLSQPPRCILSVANRRWVGYAVQRNGRLFLHIDGREKVFAIVSEDDEYRQKGAAGAGDLSVVAPMPGTVIKILVEPGQRVKPNQPLAIVEAMKMENEVRASGEAVVKQILAAPGEQVGFGQELIELAPPTADEAQSASK
ncbi:MAG: hypothetical protein FJY65_07680 [Calditrichaeota bacterium]|nr:hypothetical protein [Calditrichota bacterium]